MMRKKSNNKGFLFFVILLLVGYIFVSFGQDITLGNEVKENSSDQQREIVPPPQEISTEDCCIQEQIYFEEPEIGVVMLDEEYTIDISEEVAEGMTGEVLPISSIFKFFNCADYNRSGLIDSVTKLCPEATTELEYDRGFLSTITDFIFRSNQQVRIDNENSDFKFTLVTYPLAFFLGQYVVQNSNREANIESPNYSSSGQAVDENYTLKTHSPHMIGELKELFAETRRKEFGVKAEIGILDLEGGSSKMNQDEGEIMVKNTKDEPECFCNDDRISTSDYNPFDPNRQGFEGGGYFRQQIPGWTPEEQQVQGCLDVPEGSIKKIGLTQGAVPACLNLLEGFKGLVQSVFSVSRFDSCMEDSANCTDLKGIVIKMSPIFGDPNECTDELCTNAYLANAYRAGLNPIQTGELVTVSSDPTKSLMFFIGTPCAGNLRIGGKTFPITATCLWDASPLLLDYNLQAMFKSPGQEEFPPTFDFYWSLVEEAIKISAKRYGLTGEGE